MLKKLLSKISLRKQSQRQPKQKAQSQTDAFQTLGLNLLSGFKDTPTTTKVTQDNLSKYRIFIVSLSALFGVLLIINYVLGNRLDQLKSNQEDLSLKVLRYFQVEKDAKDIHERTSYYKHKQDEKQKVLGKVTFVFEPINSSVTLTNVRISEERFTLSAKGKTPLTFTRLIAKYLEGDMVSEIILKSASYNSRAEEFRVDMEGVFK